MPRLSLHVSLEFEQLLSEFMRRRRIRTKSDAVRLAVLEAVERERLVYRAPNFSQWLGLGRQAPENPNPRFRSDHDLWS
jgi:hypothetical protein